MDEGIDKKEMQNLLPSEQASHISIFNDAASPLHWSRISFARRLNASAPTSQESTFPTPLYLFSLYTRLKCPCVWFWKVFHGLLWQLVGICKIFAQNNSIVSVFDWFWHFPLDWILVWAAELNWNISLSSALKAEKSAKKFLISSRLQIASSAADLSSKMQGRLR